MGNITKEICEHYEKYTGMSSDIAKKIYLYAQWLGVFSCKKEFFIKRSGLKSVLLIQTISGKGKILYKNTEMILDSKKIVLLDCMQPHTYFPVGDENWTFRFIHFSGKNSFEILKHLYSLNGGYAFPFTPAIEQNILNCLEDCKFGVDREVSISKYLHEILYDLILSFQEQSRMDEVCEYIKKNYSKKISTEVLANHFGFSRSYFSVEFKKRVGTTIHDYILSYRLYQAKALLSDENNSIFKIAESVGFSDVGTFIRAFKKVEKMTPLQYKKMYF
ncbi:MAG: helix-turn-helix transcriptional regulator [Clostridia bacterium]|nr:helix-turn-helix transcriptional regulator [Clostridia bacterium]